MTGRSRDLLFARFAAAVAASLLLLGFGCGGSDDGAAPPVATGEPALETEPADTETPAAADGLPEYVAGYETWTKLNDEPIPPRESGDAHLGTKDIFASAASTGDLYPPGTIIVKEATRPDADFVGLVAVMRKIDGFSPENNDWEMIEYTRGSPEEPFSEIASGGVCYSCHAGAREVDYVCSADGDVCP